jgi:hypothetical protein
VVEILNSGPDTGTGTGNDFTQHDCCSPKRSLLAIVPLFLKENDLFEFNGT